MAATTLVRDALYRVSTLLQDISPNQFVRWTNKELVIWMNDGQRAIAKYLPQACSRVDAIKLVAGTKQSIDAIPTSSFIGGDGLTPDVPVRGLQLYDVIRNMGVDGATPGGAIRVIPREVQDNISADWHKASSASNGAVEHYVFDPRNPRIFYVVPGVGAAAKWVEVSYNASPIDIPLPTTPTQYSAIGSDSTVIGVDDAYVDELANYTVARAFMKDSEFGDAKNAQLYGQMFINSINILVQIATGQNPNLSFLPFSPQFPPAAR